MLLGRHAASAPLPVPSEPCSPRPPLPQLNILLERSSQPNLALHTPAVHLAGTTLRGRLDLVVGAQGDPQDGWQLGEISIELQAIERWVSATEWIERDVMDERAKIRYQGPGLPPSAACHRNFGSDAAASDIGFHTARSGKTSLPIAFDLPAGVPSTLPSAGDAVDVRSRTSAAVTYLVVASAACQLAVPQEDASRDRHRPPPPPPAHVVVARRELVVVSDRDVAKAALPHEELAAKAHLQDGRLLAQLEVCRFPSDVAADHDPRVLLEGSIIAARLTLQHVARDALDDNRLQVKLKLARRIRPRSSAAHGRGEILETLAEQALDGLRLPPPGSSATVDLPLLLPVGHRTVRAQAIQSDVVLQAELRTGDRTDTLSIALLVAHPAALPPAPLSVPPPPPPLASPFDPPIYPAFAPSAAPSDPRRSLPTPTHAPWTPRPLPTPRQLASASRPALPPRSWTLPAPPPPARPRPLPIPAPRSQLAQDQTPPATTTLPRSPLRSPRPKSISETGVPSYLSQATTTASRCEDKDVTQRRSPIVDRLEEIASNEDDVEMF